MQTCFEYITFRTFETTRKNKKSAPLSHCVAIALGAAVIHNTTSIQIHTTTFYLRQQKYTIKQIASTKAKTPVSPSYLEGSATKLTGH